MTLTPVWRTRLFAAAGTILAVAFGVQIAHGAYFWPAVGAGMLLALIVVQVQSRPLTTLLLAGALFGYIVGNRGFAQVSLVGGFPLFTAEFVLAVGGTILLVQSAWRRELPFRTDALNLLLLLWMALGTLRFGLSVPEYGLGAVRDYALVYYAGFFFLAQSIARDEASVRLLRRTLLAACGALLVVHPLFTQFPGFFLNTLTIRGIPLVFYKDDLAGNFMAAGAVLYFLEYERTRRWRWLVVALALAGLMLTTNSRSSMLGLAVAAGWLALRGRWRFAGILSAGAIAAAAVILVAAYLHNQSWRQTPLHRIYDRVVSIFDPLGQRAYASEDAFKGDNNVFRTVWWQASITETLETRPWFGLGFGHDLASRFVRQYFPEGSDEFTARSPHNVLITVFARLGAVGFAVFAAALLVMAARTWRALASAESLERSGFAWLAAWVILVAAGFGVVLEGPMGAVVFWTLLGLAHGVRPAPDAGENSTETVRHLREAAVPGEFADAS